MNNVRYVVTFLILVVVVVLAMFQMKIRGYEEVGRIQAYVLYVNDDDLCVDETFNIEDRSYVIACASQYVLKSGFAEYTITEALTQEIITIEDVEEDLTITEE